MRVWPVSGALDASRCSHVLLVAISERSRRTNHRLRDFEKHGTRRLVQGNALFVFLLVFAVVLLHLFRGVLILVGGFLFIVMISGVLLADVVFLLDVGLAVFLLPRREAAAFITGLVVGGVGFFFNRKVCSAGRIAGVDVAFLAIFLVKVLLLTVGLRAADADTGR